MIKILLLMALGYIGFRLIKSAVLRHLRSLGKTMNDKAGDIEDVMIQDPFCGVYFPRATGVPLAEDGKTLYFCSTQCRDQYLRQKREKNTG